MKVLGQLDEYCANYKCDDIIMLLGLFYMYGNRRPLIGWNSVSSNYLDVFCVVTLITRKGFQHVISEVLTYVFCSQ